MKTRDEAMALLAEYTQSASLLKHALAVECAMRWYAQHFQLPAEEVEKWGITGLLHDFDYEKYPEPVSPNGHPYKGNEILAELGYPEDVRRAIMGHALYTNTPRDTQMAKTLFAVDELSGLVTASVLVRPDKNIHNLEAKSVLKKMKDKAFARGCSREDIRLGAEEMGIELETQVANVIKAMQGQAAELGLAGV
ncbi:MAG: HD domain-containing protein [Deltaproteobacteria bacterium]|nr:HD domain-containing protein [Deltaproteobacteria bacterium]